MSRVVAVFALLWLTACAPGPPTRGSLPPPLLQTPESTWAYGAYLLAGADAAGALAYVEPLQIASLPEGETRALALRDLAEARLFANDLVGAAAASAAAKAELARQPMTAQFRADDRYVFERTLDALAAASRDDSQALRQLASDEARAPSADAWYLLGWLAERRGETATARDAYAAFLARAPRWAFLRQAIVMRRHALAATQ